MKQSGDFFSSSNCIADSLERTKSRKPPNGVKYPTKHFKGLDVIEDFYYTDNRYPRQIEPKYADRERLSFESRKFFTSKTRNPSLKSNINVGHWSRVGFWNKKPFVNSFSP